MRPIKLILENIGPFTGRNELDFTALPDIFLVSGKTGSGKSTIFDSICWALYGKLPGSGKGLERRLRSDFCSPEEESRVSLDFSLGEKSWRIERSPSRERPSKKGSGMVIEEESLVLYEWREGNFQPIIGKKTELNDYITSLIGLSVEEFSRVILLPQGEFAAFLKQNSSERRKVLAKLFPVDTAVAIRELARQKASDLKASLKESEATLRQRMQDMDIQQLDARKQELQTAVQESKAAAEKAELELERATLSLSSVRERLEQAETQLARVKQEENLLASLEASNDEIDHLREQLDRNEAARPLHIANQHLKTEKEHEAELRLQLEAAQKEAQLREHELAEAQKELSTAKTQKSAWEALRLWTSSLNEAAALETELSQDSAALKRMQADALRLQKLAEEAAQNLKALETEQESLSQIAENRLELETEFDTLKARLESLKEQKGFAQEYSTLRTEQNQFECTIAEAQSRLKETQEKLKSLEAEQAATISALEKQRIAQEAARLALTLEAGSPCPVCGALEHPNPARAHKGADDGDEQLTRLQTLKEEYARNETIYSTRLNDAKGSLRGMELRFESFIKRAGAAEFPSPEQVEHEIKEVSARLTELAPQRQKALSAHEQKHKLLEKIRLASDQNSEHGAAFTAMQQRISEQQALTEKHTRRYTELFGNGKAPDAAAPLIGRTFNNAKEAIDYCNTLLHEHQTRDEKLTQRIQQLSAGAAEQSGRLEQLQSNLSQTAKRCEELAASLRKDLNDSLFSTARELEEALLDAEEAQRGNARLTEWTEAITGCRARLAAARESCVLDEHSLLSARQELDGLQAALEEARARRQAAREAAQAAQERLNELIRREHEYHEAEARRQELSILASRAEQLSKDLSGSNPQKISFDEWLLSMYLYEVTRFATERLKRMSDGRYRLILGDGEHSDRRSTGGLDLAVFDACTGRARPCSTLSGGESFMASISLALGLADSIQSRSGGIRLDAVFIDEGFGSLDEESLEQALMILDEIRGHRMVGMISHVSGMKNRFPGRVEVQKSSAGSSITVWNCYENSGKF